MLRKIETPKTQVQETVVSHLEMLLEHARNGEIESLLWFVDYADSAKMQWGTSGAKTSADEVAVIGRLDVLRHTFITRFTEET